MKISKVLELIVLFSVVMIFGCSSSEKDNEYWLQYHEADGYWEYSAGAIGTKEECENHLVRYGGPKNKYVKVSCAPRPKGTKGTKGVLNE